MKYFTAECHQATPDEANHIYAAYQEYLSRIAPRMPQSIRELALRTNLHEGRIRRVVHDPTPRTLLLELRCGDNKTGYFDLDILYKEVSLGVSDIALLKEIVSDPQAEALYGELEIEEPDTYIHHLMFLYESKTGNSAGDWNPVTIRFKKLELKQSPRPDRSVSRKESEL
jgi:hypothetical protein